MLPAVRRHNARAVRIRLAREEDWPVIDEWRDDHFARMADRAPYVMRFYENVRGLGDAVWIVAENENAGILLAALSFFDEPHKRICNAYDLYTEKTFSGVSAGLALVEFLLEHCDNEKFTLLGETDAANTEYRAVLSKFGCVETSIGFQRMPSERKT